MGKTRYMYFDLIEVDKEKTLYYLRYRKQLL